MRGSERSGTQIRRCRGFCLRMYTGKCYHVVGSVSVGGGELVGELNGKRTRRLEGGNDMLQKGASWCLS